MKKILTTLIVLVCTFTANAQYIDLQNNVTNTLLIANGGVGATSYSGARTNLGLVIGTNVEAWNAILDSIVSNATTNKIPYYSSGTTLAAALMSGDCISSSMVVTCTKTNGNAFATSATTDATNATNITSGTLPAARLPLPTASTLGGIQSLNSTTHLYVTGLSTGGVLSTGQPVCADLSNGGTACTASTGTSGANLGFLNGNNTYSGTSNFTGTFEIGGITQAYPTSGNIVGTTDTQTLTNKSIAASEVNSGTLALAQLPTGTTSSNVVIGGTVTAGGPVGSATVSPIITYNAAGQITAVSSATISPAIGSVTGLGTGVATALATAQGNGTKVQLSTGTTATNDCVKFDANGNTVDAGAACGGGGGGSGTVTTLSVVSTNGLTGSVSNPTTTPAITMGTTVSGLIAGSGGALVQASAAMINAPVVSVMTNSIVPGSATPTSLGMSTTLVAGATYSFELFLYMTDSTGGSLGLNGGSVTATSLNGISTSFHTSSVSNVTTILSSLSTTQTTGTAASQLGFLMTGTLVVNAGGTFVPTFASSTAATDSVNAGSWMRLTRIN